MKDRIAVLQMLRLLSQANGQLMEGGSHTKGQQALNLQTEALLIVGTILFHIADKIGALEGDSAERQASPQAGDSDTPASPEA